MKKNILIVVTLIIIAAIAYYLYLRLRPMPALPAQTSQTSTTSTETTSTVSTVTSTSTQTMASSTTQIFMSSSSAQVGKFTVVTDCDESDGQTVLKQIEIFEGGNLEQTISDQSVQSADLGGAACPKPEARDINSDGYIDFSVVNNYGNKDVDSVYWLYNSSTNQFSCPNANANSGKPWMACYLVEPY